MNEIQVFNNPDFGEVRTLEENDMVLFRSKLPTAEKFTAWVTGTVLPSIRRHGT